MARAEYTKVVTITAGASLSSAVYVGGLQLVSIQLPSTWTTAGITFQGALDGSGNEGDAGLNATFVNLQTSAAAELAVSSIAASFIITVANLNIDSMRWLKIRSGTSGSPVTQVSSVNVLLGFSDLPL